MNVINCMFYFLITLCSLLENTVLNEGNIQKGMSLLNNLKSSKDYLISYILRKYFLDNPDSSIQTDACIDLILSNEYMELIYSAQVLSSKVFYDNALNIASYLLKVGQRACKRYLDNNYEFSPKIYFKNKEENYNNLLIMTRGLDKKSIQTYFNLLSTKKLKLKNQISLLEYLASKDVGQAYGYLGEAYLYGIGVQKSIDKALDYFLKGKAISRNQISYNGIGKILMSSEYEDFIGAKEHFDSFSNNSISETDFFQYILYNEYFKIDQYSTFYLSRAVSVGYLPAMYVDGERYFKKKDYGSAIVRLKPILEYDETVIELQDLAYEKYKNKNYISSLIHLLMTVEMGSSSSLDNAIYLLENKKINLSKSTVNSLLYKLYIKQTNTTFKNVNRVGDCYYYGRGVKQSYNTAFSYYLTSATFNETEGLVNLYFMYERGLGVEKDLLEAFKILQKIRMDDQTYLLICYLYIIFVFRVIFTTYIIISIGTGIVAYKIYTKHFN